MRYRRRIVAMASVLATLLVVLALPVAALADDAAVSAAAKSVVRVFTVYSDGTASTGTAFAVGTDTGSADTFVTNRHVVVNEETGQSARRIYLIKDDNSLSYSADQYFLADTEGNIVGYYEENQDWNADTNRMVSCDPVYTAGDGEPDIAIIKATEALDGYQPMRLERAEQASQGSSVYVVGFPGSSDSSSVQNDMERVGTQDVDGETYTVYHRFLKYTWKGSQGEVTYAKGIISRFTTFAQENDVKIIQTDANIRSGNSGGPVITEDGNVIGVATYSFGSESADENGAAIYVDYVMDELDEQGIGYLTADSAQQSLPVLPIAIGGCVVVAVVVVVVVLVVRKRKKGSAPNAKDGGEGDGGHVEPPAPAPAPAPTPKPEPRPCVFSMAAQHGGARITLKGRITIGRSDDCKIVFSKDTPGVSSRHCSLEYDDANRCFLLCDLNSTYGTYLSNGQKLTPGVEYRLQPGDSFYLGEGQRNNMLRVELR